MKQLTFNKLIKEYYNSPAFTKLGANTKKYYELFINNRAVNMAPLCKVGTQISYECRTWFEEFDKLEISSESKNIYLAIIKGIFSWAKNHEEIPANPLKNLKNFRDETTKEKRDAYTIWEIEKLRSTAQTHSEKVYANFLYGLFYTGCRPSELVNLDWNDVEEQFINIRSAKWRVEGKIGRKCHIIDKLEEAIDCALTLSGLRTMEGRVFGAPNNGEINLSNARKNVKALCQKAVVPYKGLRSARSGLATAMMKSGKYSVYDVQQTLGHKRMSTTQKYIRETMEDKALRFRGL